MFCICHLLYVKIVTLPTFLFLQKIKKVLLLLLFMGKPLEEDKDDLFLDTSNLNLEALYKNKAING